MNGAFQQILQAMGGQGGQQMGAGAGDQPPIAQMPTVANQTGLGRPYDPAAVFYQVTIKQLKTLAQIVTRLGDQIEGTYLEKMAVDLQEHRNKRVQDFIKKNQQAQIGSPGNYQGTA